jgi:hypothetical protein
METPYHYISSIDYINSFTFDYVEVYTFQRGADFEESLKLIKPEYDRLKVRKERRNNLTPAEEDRFLELNTLLGFTQYILSENGQFHPSSKKTNTFQFSDPEVVRLTSILRTEVREIPRWLCAPVYRDAIVFYDKHNNIISTLNICLSCQYMETKMFNLLNADYETYDLLKRFFIDIGHDVEDPTKFVLDDMKKMREKYSRKKSS